MATISAKDLAKIESDKKAKIAAKEQGKERAYQTQLMQAPEGYRNNPQFQAALRDVVNSEWQGNTSVAVPLREKLNAIVTQLDPFPNGKENTNDPRLRQAYGNAYAQKLVNVEGGLLRKESGALSEASKQLGLSPDYSQGLVNTILGEPNTSGGGMGFFSSIGKVLNAPAKAVGQVVSGIGKATGLPTATKIGDALQDPTLKGLTRALVPISGGIKPALESAEDMAKVAAIAAAAYYGGGALLAGAGGAAGAGAAGAGAAGAGSTVLGSSTLGSLASSLGLSGAVNAAPSVLSSLGLSGAGAAAGTAAGGASPYFVGGAIPYTGGALSAGGSTLLGSSTLAGLANSLGLGGLVEGAPSVLSSLGLSGGSTSLGSGVLSQLLGGGGAAGGQGGLGSLGGLLGGGGGGGNSLLQDLLIGGGSLASGIYGANTANEAAKLQAGAVDKALGSIQTGYDTGRGDLQPYYTAGTKSLAEIQNLQGMNQGGFSEQQYLADNPDVAAEVRAGKLKSGFDHFQNFGQREGRNGQFDNQQLAFNRFQKSPDYQFRFGEGQKALQGTAAAKGSLYSGNTAKALTDYGQGMASQEYGNYFNRLNNTSQQGAQTAGTLANLSQNYFGNQADLLRTKGDAIASGKVAGANAYQGTLQNLTQYLTAPQYKGLF